MYYLLIIVILLVLIYFYFMNENKDKLCIYFLGHYVSYPSFEDYVRSLIYKLKQNDISYKVFTNSIYKDSFFNNSDKNIIYVIIHNTEILHISDKTKKKIINKTYIINTEQLTKQNELVRILNYVNEGFKIIDYSIGNIRILDKNYSLDNIVYIPYQVNYDEIYNDMYRPKDICTITPFSSANRKKIYMAAKSTKLFKITPIYGYGPSRDYQILKHKILLNIHYNEYYRTYESIRCDRLIFNKTIILSEFSNEKSIPEDLREYIIQFSNIEELKTKLEILSVNTEEYYKNFWNNFDLKRIDTHRIKYYNYWINSINLKDNFTNANGAYVINLDERKDRWKRIQKSFEDSSIKLNRVSAIKNKNGNIGCGLSFMKIVKLAKEKKLKTVLIFEDDNKPLDNFDDRWNIIKNWLDNNLDKWDIFNGGARFHSWGKITNDKIPDDCKTIKLAYNIDNKEYLFKNDIMLSTNWIYINSSVYDKILEWENNTNINIDNYIANREKFKNVFCLPLLALQEDTKSNINNFDYTSDTYNKYIINTYKNVFNMLVNKNYG